MVWCPNKHSWCFDGVGVEIIFEFLKTKTVHSYLVGLLSHISKSKSKARLSTVVGWVKQEC